MCAIYLNQICIKKNLKIRHIYLPKKIIKEFQLTYIPHSKMTMNKSLNLWKEKNVIKTFYFVNIFGNFELFLKNNYKSKFKNVILFLIFLKI